MNEADRHAVGLVGFRAWRSSNAFEEVYHDPAVIARVQDKFSEFAAKAHCDIAVVEIDGEIAGWGARDGEPNHISDLWVDPNWQGRGLGRALVEHFLEKMRAVGISTATISTHARNVAAIRLYQRCGFEIVWQGQQWSDSMKVELEKVRLERAL
ncbi:GNAT family N-acetyltransferase [Agrobacterium sp.]|uniref:GNAT family N-acetyltransferase n=1 Tax=Agrobacterium sp. TaxID=361 RepID=UPI0028A7008C|nr:GNAT family N-acetyltransferase [Agrobacterium sp.]